MADTTVDATRRLNVKKQTLDDAYAAPANFLEIDVINPITHGVGKKRYTDYEVRMRVSKLRYSFFSSFSSFPSFPSSFSPEFFLTKGRRALALAIIPSHSNSHYHELFPHCSSVRNPIKTCPSQLKGFLNIHLRLCPFT